jgi:uncharacterized protein (DUF342 family)
LVAELTVAEGACAGAAELLACLRVAGVVYGVRDEVCAELARGLVDPSFRAERVRVAEGRSAQAGTDGAFVPAFEYGIRPGHLREDGSMDFMDRELLKSVRAGECLGELRLASRGSSGRSVDGREVPARAGKELVLELGAGVTRLPDGRVTALRAGVVLYTAGKKLDVVQRHEHSAEVDLRSGHLTMEGSIVVQKSVHRPFQVAASGDVEIRGAVEGGSVYAGGSILVKGGVTGGDTSVLSAAGDVSMRHAERVRVACAGLLQVENAVNCELSAAQIQVKGQLRGGTASAERTIEMAQAGALSGGATLLAAGVPLERPLDEVRRALDAAKQERALRGRSFGAARAAPERGKQGKRERASAALVRDALEHKLQLAAQREMLLGAAAIEVRGTAHVGVTVRIGEAQLVVESPLSNVRFSFDRGLRSVRSERLVR